MRCQEEHSSCSEGMKQGWYPTRLLDVSKDEIRLCNSNDGPLSGSYATLSHCWGTEEFAVLTTKTLSDLQGGWPMSFFPLTFQQTIITIRRLGIRCLWIDCYCIIQGDERDWEQEAFQMGQVYLNAIINIGAGHASDPSQGLFASRKTDLEKFSI